MEDVLLDVGAIVTINNSDFDKYIIVGKRIINFNTMNSWDYYGVPYPQGLELDRNGKDNNGYYFNHEDINEIV